MFFYKYIIYIYRSLSTDGWKRRGVVDRESRGVGMATTTAKWNRGRGRGDDGEGRYGGLPWRGDGDEKRGLGGDGGPWRRVMGVKKN